MSLENLYKEAERLAGRPVEVEKTKDGKHIVLFLQFEKSPPPKGESEEEALQGFIEYMLNKKPSEDNLEPENTKENTDDDRDRPLTESN